MLRMKEIGETTNLNVYTDTGDLFGVVEDAIITKNKIDSWRVKVTRDSFLNKTLSGAKGVIIPHQLVKAIGTIMIVSKAAAPSFEEEVEE